MSAACDIPSSWTRAPLGQFARTSTGGTPSRAVAANFGGSIPWVKSGELGDGMVRSVEETISEAGLASSSAKVFPRGTLCIALYGATVGRVGILDMDAATNQAICGIFLPDGIDTRFMFYFLLSQRRQLIDQGKGGAQSNISNAIVRETQVPVPPTPEQRRIVAKIEELFSDLDAGVAALGRVRANLKRYRAAVLKAAVEGRLTEEWRRQHPNTEPAAKLLERILADRRAKWEQDQLRRFKEAGKTPPKGWKEKYSPPDTGSGGSDGTPTGWVRTSVDQVSLLDVGFAFKSEQFTQEGVRLLRGENIEPGALRWKETRFWPPGKIDEFTHLLVNEGDIILAMDRPIVSSGLKVCRAKAHDLPCLLVQRVARFRPIDANMTAFLYLAVQTRQFIGHVLAGQTGTQLPHISGQEIASFSFVMPPLAEQSEIVAEVDRRLSVADAAEVQVEHALQRATRLRQSILKRAFEGRLVDQHPSDEPAAGLLQRIKAGSNGHQAVIRNNDKSADKPTKRRSRADA